MMGKIELDKKNVGLRIRRAREARGWTREQLAEKMELSVNAVANLELGQSGTQLEHLVGYCSLLGLNVDFVLFGESEETVQTIAALLRDRDTRTQKMAEHVIRAMLDAMDAD